MRVSILLILLLLGSLTYAQSNSYAKADSIAGLYSNHSLEDLQDLSKKLTSSFNTDNEKFRAIYKWVCLNIDYDLDLQSRINSKRNKLNKKDFIKWNSNESQKMLDELINHKRTVCTGYAYLVRRLCYYAGITCEIVDGYGGAVTTKRMNDNAPDHSWNAVLLNGEWYLSDPTWSSGYASMDARTFTHSFDESYFLADPKIFIHEHHPVESGWSLLR